MKNLIPSALTLLAAALALTTTPASAQLAGEYNQQQAERAGQVDRCYSIYRSSPFGASADRRDHDRLIVTTDGTVIKSSARFDGTECSYGVLGSLNRITPVGTTRSVSQIVLEGSELVEYLRLHSRVGEPTVTRRVIGSTDWLIK